MCGSDICLGIIAILFPPFAVWVKRGLCSADSLINIALCILGFLPGLLHACKQHHLHVHLPRQRLTKRFCFRVHHRRNARPHLRRSAPRPRARWQRDVLLCAARWTTIRAASAGSSAEEAAAGVWDCECGAKAAGRRSGCASGIIE